MFSQLPVQPSTEYTCTDTLNYDPNFYFDGACHKTQSQTSCYPSINLHICHGQPLRPSIILLSTCSLVTSVGGGGPEQEQGRVVGGGGVGGREGSRGRRRGGGGVSFYLDNNVEEEDLPSKLDDDSDSSEDEWGEGIEDGEDADREKKITTSQSFVTMT